MTAHLGRDVLCVDSLKTGRYATGAMVVAQGAYHRLITERGSLPGSDEFGFDLTGLIGRSDSAEAAAALPGQIRNELLKDERIDEDSLTVTVDRSVNAAGESSYEITVYADTADGPFELVVEVSAVTVQLLKISEAA